MSIFGSAMRKYFKHESATGYVTPLDAGSYLVMGIRSNFKREGHGTGLMYEICRWADENRYVLFLEARIFESRGMPNNAMLQIWYESFGFVRQNPKSRERRMIRYPRENYMAPNEKDVLPQPGSLS